MQFTVRGRVYVPVEGISLDRNAWMMKWAKEAGLTRVVDQPEPENQEAAHRQLEQLIEDAFASDAVVPLLAGVLVLEGREWSREGAAETMREFGLARDAEAAALLEGFAGLVVTFLRRAPAFWRTIGRSSPDVGSDEAAGARDSEQDPRSPMPTPEASTTSPGDSPSTTPSD